MRKQSPREDAICNAGLSWRWAILDQTLRKVLSRSKNWRHRRAALCLECVSRRLCIIQVQVSSFDNSAPVSALDIIDIRYYRSLIRSIIDNIKEE